MSTVFRRTLLTSARSSFFRAPTTTSTINRAYQPLFSQQTRFFSATMAAKEGVHVLKNKGEFDEAMGQKDTLMVLDCYATWCGPCKVIAPTVVKCVSPHHPSLGVGMRC